MIMFTDIKTNVHYLSLKEEFLRDLAKNLKDKNFEQFEKSLREKLRKEIDGTKTHKKPVNKILNFLRL